MRARLKECIQSRDAVLWLTTAEEERTLSIISQVARGLKRVVFEWDSAGGFRCRSATKARLHGDEGSTHIGSALTAVETYNQDPAVFVFRDFDILWDRIRALPDSVPIVRQLRQLAVKLKSGKNTLIFLSCSQMVPPEIEPCVSLLRAPLPDMEELGVLFKQWMKTNGFKKFCTLDEDGLYRLAAAALGMTSVQALAALAKSLVRRKEIGQMAVADMVEAKTEVLKKTGLLELVQSRESFDTIGGLGELKDWLQKRSLAYSKAAKTYGLPGPKGVLLLGVPGTGKSLTAKAVGNFWGMPLVRLDVGRIYGSLVGESEERLRRALEIIEGVAPCVLWIDEIEKALAGSTGPSGDSGVSKRLFGSILTWLQEKEAHIFVVATANDIRSLPPEMLRRGRFDEVFFVDLPNDVERREIIKVLLNKYGRKPSGLITNELISRLDRFTGAEIEQVVVEALYNAFYDDQRKLTVGDLIEVARDVSPIADQMRTEIEALRRWGRTQARMASSGKGD